MSTFVLLSGIIIGVFGFVMLFKVTTRNTVQEAATYFVAGAIAIVLAMMLILPMIDTNTRKVYCRVDNGVTQTGDCFYR